MPLTKKDGHIAIAVLLRAALHPGTVDRDSIFKSQENLSSLLEKMVLPFKYKYTEAHPNNLFEIRDNLFEIPLDDFQTCVLGQNISFEEAELMTNKLLEEFGCEKLETKTT